ncbi:MAG: hypothetical protein JSS32_00305 [Verrucomicrobia bacterium]|nr:hypothetical protein [Verrucomicrobiota bacterium]
MSGFVVLGRDFTSTWNRIAPYFDDRGDAHQKTYKTAEKAVYRFICELCNQGCFEVGLNNRIRALDEENECNGDMGGSPHIQEMNESIGRALKGIKAEYLKANNREALVAQKIQPVFDLAQRYMGKEIGKGWLLYAMVNPW